MSDECGSWRSGTNRCISCELQTVLHPLHNVLNNINKTTTEITACHWSSCKSTAENFWCYMQPCRKHGIVLNNTDCFAEQDSATQWTHQWYIPSWCLESQIPVLDYEEISWRLIFHDGASQFHETQSVFKSFKAGSFGDCNNHLLSQEQKLVHHMG